MTNRLKNKGFTLVELLVVITIIAIISLVVFINLRSFEEDKELVAAAANLQNFFRLAQTNATTTVKCGAQTNATWFVTFVEKTRVELGCRLPTATTLSNLSKRLIFNASIEISSIEGTSPCSYPVNITYSPLYGLVEFENANGCVSRSPKVKVTLKSSTNKMNQTKVVTINKVGTVNVE